MAVHSIFFRTVYADLMDRQIFEFDLQFLVRFSTLEKYLMIDIFLVAKVLNCLADSPPVITVTEQDFFVTT